MNKAAFIKNLFTLLAAEEGAQLNEKKSLLLSARELGVSKEQLTEFYKQWRDGANDFIAESDSGENRKVTLCLISALLNEDKLPPPVEKKLLTETEKFGVTPAALKQVFSARPELLKEPSFLSRARQIGKRFFPNGKESPNGVGAQKERATDDFYIASQVTSEGFDELQRLVLAQQLGVHCAIDGPPGVGKTSSVIEAARILNRTLHTKTCSSRTTESHIISFPTLTVSEGASVTTHVNGPLTTAMAEGAIFYGDEFNLLKEDVQKRMNSAFDERRSIDRADGQQIHALPGFWAVISYNPTQNLVSRDLEESVADRFMHLNFHRWSPDFKAYVAALKAGQQNVKLSEENAFNISLAWRGISSDFKFFSGKMDNGKLSWYDFFSGQPSRERPDYIYLVNDEHSIIKRVEGQASENLDNLAAGAFQEIELARLLARFTDLLFSLSQNGKSPLLKKIGLSDLPETEDLELLSLHNSSARIEMVALRHYHELLGRGCNRYLAQTYAVNLVIDQVCYGQYREKKLRNSSVYTLVKNIARGMRFFASTSEYNTKLSVDSILRDSKKQSDRS